MYILILLAAVISLMVFTSKIFISSLLNSYSKDLAILLEKTAAFYDFVVFVIKVNTALICLCSFLQVSNHLIISLEILYLFSTLILILFHSIKEALNLQYVEI